MEWMTRRLVGVKRLGHATVIEVRLDSAFFSEKILRFLIKIGLPYAVKMPLWKWTGVKELINQRERWCVASRSPARGES